MNVLLRQRRQLVGFHSLSIRNPSRRTFRKQTRRTAWSTMYVSLSRWPSDQSTRLLWLNQLLSTVLCPAISPVSVVLSCVKYVVIFGNGCFTKVAWCICCMVVHMLYGCRNNVQLETVQHVRYYCGTPIGSHLLSVHSVECLLYWALWISILVAYLFISILFTNLNVDPVCEYHGRNSLTNGCPV